MQVLPTLLSPEEAANHLGVKTRTVHQLVRERKLACIQISAKDRKFTQAQIQEFIDSRTIPTPKPVDRKSHGKLPSPRKGGGDRNLGDSAKALREEMRSWR
jgi:excisionase family DNA binding protein